jgi:hypothetical protein
MISLSAFLERTLPSGGNNDDIRTSLVDLLYLSHECASSSALDEDFTWDVIDFIYHEIKDAIIQRNTLPYAPLHYAPYQALPSGV